MSIASNRVEDGGITVANYAAHGEFTSERRELLPRGWAWRPIRALFTERNERDFPELPVLSVSQSRGVIPQRYADDEIVRSSEDKSMYKRACPGDLVYNKMRMWQGAVGVAAEEGIVSPAYIVVRPRAQVCSRFVEYVLKAPRFVVESGRRSYGLCDDMNSLRYEDFRKIVIPCPPFEIQELIVRAIDARVERVDALVIAKTRQIELLREQRESLICHVVSKGLDKNVALRTSKTVSLGVIPAHWNIKALMWLVPAFRQIMYGIVLPGPNVEKGVPIVKGGDVSPDRLRLDLLNKTSFEIEAGYKRSRLSPGDIVYAIRGSIGMAALIPAELAGANLTQDAARIAPKDGIDSRWLLYAMQSASFFGPLAAKARGATIRGINIWDLKRAVVAVPPELEQRAIAAYLDRETSRLVALARKVQSGIEVLREYRSALISSTIVGGSEYRLVLGN